METRAPSVEMSAASSRSPSLSWALGPPSPLPCLWPVSLTCLGVSQPTPMCPRVGALFLGSSFPSRPCCFPGFVPYLDAFFSRNKRRPVAGS